jgi:hypothetical protein
MQPNRGTRGVLDPDAVDEAMLSFFKLGSTLAMTNTSRCIDGPATDSIPNSAISTPSTRQSPELCALQRAATDSAMPGNRN